MSDVNNDWAVGYAKQALSDLNIREILVDSNVEKCHRLHFLQMAAEKICKAYLTRMNGHDELKKKHSYVQRNLPIIAKQYYSYLNNSSSIPKWEISYINKVAREIELLAPACHEEFTRVDNSEYPWASPLGEIKIPCEYNFPEIDDMDRNIVRLIRLIQYASQELISGTWPVLN